jgi:hypothetical protein
VAHVQLRARMGLMGLMRLMCVSTPSNLTSREFHVVTQLRIAY